MNLATKTASGGHASGDHFINLEHLFGSEHADILTGDGTANVISGDKGNDVITGGGGADKLYGGSGDDKLYGGSGTDVLVGQAGEDYLDGGPGEDVLSYATSTSGVNVNLATKTATGGHASGDHFINLEHLFGSDHADILTGDAAANVISGGKGDDVITGGGGPDRLHGNDGSDRFVLLETEVGTPTRFLRIRDFQDGSDKLELRQTGDEVVQKTAHGNHTVLWLGTTKTKVLALLDNVTLDQITTDDFYTPTEIV